MRSILIAFAAVALTVTVGVMAQVGGVPARLRLQSLGVGQAAPAGVGNIAATGTVTAATINATALQIGGIDACRANMAGCPIRNARVLSSGSLNGGFGAASAVRNSTGSYTITWSSPITGTAPVCSITTSQNGTPVFGTLVNHTMSGSTMNVNIYNPTTNTLADGNFHLTCTADG